MRALFYAEFLHLTDVYTDPGRLGDWCAYVTAAWMPRSLKGHRDVILEGGEVSISSHPASAQKLVATPAVALAAHQPLCLSELVLVSVF